VHSTLIILNDLLLFACASMYLGTGWSLVLFSIPPEKTIDNYYDQIIPQLALATRFLTWMTGVMCVAAAVMTVSEWHHKLWAPLIVLGAVIAATLLTGLGIFPLNNLLATHIRDPVLLDDTMRRWKALSYVRLAFWTAEWLAMAVYFGLALG
jgi:hypothetical protein